MLLVDDDHADTCERREHRRPRPDDDVDGAAADAMPLIVALAVGQPAVLDGHAVAECAAKERSHRWRERNLRHHEQRLTPGAAHVIRKPQIELGFSAPGHTVKERHSKITGVSQRCEPPECLSLLRCQDPRCGRLDIRSCRTFERVPLGGLVPQHHEPARREAAEDICGDASIAKFGERQPGWTHRRALRAPHAVFASDPPRSDRLEGSAPRAVAAATRRVLNEVALRRAPGGRAAPIASPTPAR